VPLAREFGAHVNLIPYNPIPGPDWVASRPERIEAFATVLMKAGVPVTIREPRGKDIAAACGQLRAEHAPHPPRPYLTLMGLPDRTGSRSAG